MSERRQRARQHRTLTDDGARAASRDVGAHRCPQGAIPGTATADGGGDR